MHKILVVDDEEDIVRGLDINLSAEGYGIRKAKDGKTALNLAFQENPHIVLLDVMMPGMNGLDVCRELRRKGFGGGVIMLTAKAEEIDRVVGLEIGADDYLTKPFSMRELSARIRIHLRNRPASVNEGPTHYLIGDVEIDFATFTSTRQGKVVPMTSREFDILRLLIRHRGEVITRDRLLDEVWGYDTYPTTRTVDNHILKLRKKIEDDWTQPRHILSIYGEGYKLV